MPPVDPDAPASVLERWRARARALKREVLALYFATRDPRVPWYAKALAACVVAYALSPIDLIPDFVPVLGYLDDVILVPAGIALVLKLVPPAVLEDCRERAAQLDARPTSWVGALVIALIWLGAAALLGAWLLRRLRGRAQRSA